MKTIKETKAGERTVKAWALTDMEGAQKLQEHQLGDGFYYEPGYLLYKRKKDAEDAITDEQTVVKATITYSLT